MEKVLKKQKINEEKRVTNTEKFFVECVKRGIKGEKIDCIPAGLDYQQFHRLCALHSMSVAVLRAVEAVKDALPQKILSALEHAAYRHLTYDVQSARDIDMFLAALEARGFRYMPLKGYHLKKLYPSSDMRYASDFDILIDASRLKELRKFLNEYGLKTMRRDEHHDIVYHPENKTVFELHKTMFVGAFEEYFGEREKGFEGARVKEGYKFFYEMDKERFYLSILAHSAQHFVIGGGVGIRHLSDVYLYRKTYTLDDEYLNSELEKCGLKRFKEEFEKVAYFLFDDVDAPPFTEKLAEHILSSAILANSEKKVASEVVSVGESEHRKAQKKAFWRKVFLPTEQMKFQFPVLKKAIWLLPVFHIVRWIKVIFTRPQSVGRLKEFSFVSAEDMAYIKELRTGLGIEKL